MTETRAWLDSVADEYMRSGRLSYDRQPEGVKWLVAESRPQMEGERRRRHREVRVCVTLASGEVLTATRREVKGAKSVQTVIDVQRRTATSAMRGVRAAAALCVPLNAFVLAVDVALRSADAIVPAVLIVALLFLILALTRLIGIFRARERSLSAIAERKQTLAEQVAEAVEAIRQLQWDTIAGRAYLAKPPPATSTSGARDLGLEELGRRGREFAAAVTAGTVSEAETARIFGSCAHPDAEPVDLTTGERVAWVCPACEAGLPADWR